MPEKDFGTITSVFDIVWDITSSLNEEYDDTRKRLGLPEELLLPKEYHYECDGIDWGIDNWGKAVDEWLYRRYGCHTKGWVA